MKAMTEYQRVKMIKKLLDDFQLTVDREALVKAARGNLAVELMEMNDDVLKAKLKKVTK